MRREWRIDPALCAVVALALALRLYHLGYQSIWGDEYLSLEKYAAAGSGMEALRQIWARATHPPVYFMFLHYWLLLGDSEFAIRLPSALFGAATVPIVYALANRLFGRRTALAAALMAAVSPVHVWYSQEARMYSLQVLLGTASTYFLVAAWQDRRPRDVWLYALTTALNLYTHTNSVYLLVAQGIAVLLTSRDDRRRMWRWLSIQAALGIMLVPWLANAIGSRDQGIHIGAERGSSLLDAAYGLYTFAVGFSLGPSVAELHSTPARQALQANLPALLVPALVFAALTIIGFVELRKNNRWGFTLILATLVVPPALALAMSVYPGIPLNPRYLLIAVIPYWIAVGAGVVACSRKAALRPVAAIGVALIGLSLFNHYTSTRYMKQDMRSAMAVVNREARPGDVAVISSVELGGPFEYYLRRRDLAYKGYPPGSGLVEPGRVRADLRSLGVGRRRMWLILGRTWSSDPRGLIRAGCDALYPAEDRYKFAGVSVTCYSTTSTPARGDNMR